MLFNPGKSFPRRHEEEEEGGAVGEAIASSSRRTESEEATEPPPWIAKKSRGVGAVEMEMETEERRREGGRTAEEIGLAAEAQIGRAHV